MKSELSLAVEGRSPSSNCALSLAVEGRSSSSKPKSKSGRRSRWAATARHAVKLQAEIEEEAIDTEDANAGRPIGSL